MAQYTIRGDPKATVYGQSTGGSLVPFAVDSSGRLILSPSLSIGIAANNLDIRPLNTATDSVTVFASNLDIRDLSGAQDSILRYGSVFAEDSESGTISPLSSRTFLTRDVSAYAHNTYYVQNLLGVVVNVTLQIAPVDSNNFYVADGSTLSLLGGATLLFSPSRLMKYARIQVGALLSLGNVEVRYFGRT